MSKLNPNTVWNDFKTALCNALDAFDKVTWSKAWQKDFRTPFFKQQLMPEIEGQMRLTLRTERFRCDYTFSDAHGIPHVFAESENAHTTAGHEIDALCCLAAPLKVLFLSCDWQGTERDKFLPGWCDTIRRHHAAVPLDCLYAIIVGEWDEPDDARLSYFFTLVNTDGQAMDAGSHTAKQT